MTVQADQPSGAVVSVDWLARTLSDSERTTTVYLHGLTLAPGTRVALCGDSGSGKTTALELVALATAPVEGTAHDLTTPDGTTHDLLDMARTGAQDALAAVRRRWFGYVLQSNLLLPFLDVRENIALPLRLLGRTDPAWIDHLAEALALEATLDAAVQDLSVGQQQRVCIARALAHRPAFIIADEPTSALDPAMSDRVMGLFGAMVDEIGAAVVMVTHDRDLAARHGYRIVVAQTSGERTRYEALFECGEAV